jgi:hypothetical protein
MYPIILIIVGILIFGFSFRHLVEIFISMTWLHIRVSNEPNHGNISYNFSSLFMHLISYGPVIGLTLILLGIHFLH